MSDSTTASLTQLVEHIKQAGELRRQALRNDALAEVDQLEQELATKVERLQADGRTAFATLKQETNTMILGQATRDAGALLMRRLAAVTDEQMAICHDRLELLAKGPQATAITKSLLREALEHTAAMRRPDADFVLRVRTAEAHVELCCETIKADGVDAPVVADPAIQCGVEIDLLSNQCVVRNTLASRLERLEPNLRDLLLERLEAAMTNGGAQ